MIAEAQALDDPVWFGDADVSLRLLSHAVMATLARKESPEERMWIDRIERLRANLRQSSEEMAKAVKSSKGRVSGRLLFRLVREFSPVSCLELGTCIGLSAAYQSSALELNGAGRLITVERSARLVAAARSHLDQLDLHRVEVREGLFVDVLDEVLADLAPIDYAFIDGHHDEHATVQYFKQVARSLSQTAVVVFDDITWSEGMTRAWQAILADPRVGIAVDLGNLGVCIVGDVPGRKLRIRLEPFK